MLLLLAFQTAAQTHRPDTLYFDSLGRLKALPPKKINKDTTYTIAANQNLPDKIKDALKAKLLLKVQATLDRLLDTTTGFSKFYQALWDSTTYASIGTELKELKHFLKSGSTTPGFRFTYMPAPRELADSLLEKKKQFNVGDTFRVNKNKELLTVDLVYTDPLKAWIVSRYNRDLAAASIHRFENDFDYKQEWQHLSLLLDTLKARLGALEKAPAFICTPNNRLSGDSAFYVKLQANPLLKAFRNDALYKRWIWFAEGGFRVNPLGLTTADREWLVPSHSTVKEKQFNAAIHKELQATSRGNDVSPEKIEALVQADSTGDNRFNTPGETYKETVFGFKGLDDLQQGKVTANRVLLPATLNKAKPRVLVQYDAADDYKSNLNKIPSFPEDESLAIAVHNVPPGANIVIEPKYETIADRSPAQLGMDPLFAGIGDIAGTLKPLSSVLNALNRPVQPNDPVISPDLGSVATASVSAVMLNSTMLESSTKAIQPKKVVVDGVEFPLKKKLTLMQALKFYITESGMDVPPLFTAAFFKLCRPSELNYSGIGKLKASIEKLVFAFKQFVTLSIERQDEISELKSDFKSDSLVLEVLLKLTNRSLPPDTLELEKTDSVVYRTVVPELDLSDPPKKVKYTLYETRAKKSAAATDSIKTSVAKNEFQIGKKYLFQFSAGIGVTLSDFTYKEATESDGRINVKTNSDKVRLVAGVHVYPWKLFLQDSKFITAAGERFRNRISLFAGLGLPDPLKNYYTGASFDLVPGFRLIVGAHFLRDNRYTISNNKIVEKAAAVKAAGPFLSFNIEPISFTKALGFLK